MGDQAQLVARRHERAGQHLTAFGQGVRIASRGDWPAHDRQHSPNPTHEISALPRRSQTQAHAYPTSARLVGYRPLYLSQAHTARGAGGVERLRGLDRSCGGAVRSAQKLLDAIDEVCDLTRAKTRAA